jgi:hypothetical protein
MNNPDVVLPFSNINHYEYLQNMETVVLETNEITEKVNLSVIPHDADTLMEDNYIRWSLNNNVASDESYNFNPYHSKETPVCVEEVKNGSPFVWINIFIDGFGTYASRRYSTKGVYISFPISKYF